MKIKTTLRFCIILLRMATLRKQTTNAGRMGARRKLSYTVDGNVNTGQPPEVSMEAHQKTKNRPTF
jgi:hypothetical protein